MNTNSSNYSYVKFKTALPKLDKPRTLSRLSKQREQRPFQQRDYEDYLDNHKWP